MMPPAHMRTPWWMALAAACVLGVVAVLLQWQHQHTLQRLYHEAATVRAQTLATDVAHKMTFALRLDIPLPAMFGVQAMLDHVQQEHPDVLAIDIQDAQSNTLWSAHADAPMADTVTVSAPIVLGPQPPSGTVTVYVRAQPTQPIGQHLGIWAGLLTLMSVLGFWVSRLALAMGPWLREHAVVQAAGEIRRGRFNAVALTPQACAFDTRPDQLSAGVRGVDEARQRLQRLVRSLRHTEPSAHHRELLDDILRQSTDGLQFHDSLQRQRFFAVEHQCFWISLLMGLASTSPWMWQIYATDGITPMLMPASAWYFLGFVLVAFASRFAPVPVPHALVLAWLVVMAMPWVQPHGPQGMSICAGTMGMAAGLAFQACQSAWVTARRRLIFSRPRLAHPVERAYLYAVVCIAPLLALLTQQAFSAEVARIALLIPAICGLVSFLWWNRHASPWRARIRPSPRTTRTPTSWAAAMFYLSTGLGMAATSTMAEPNLPVYAICLIAGWCCGCFVLPHTAHPLRTVVPLALLVLSGWGFVSDSSWAWGALLAGGAMGIAGAPTRLRARPCWWGLCLGITAGLVMVEVGNPMIACASSALGLALAWGGTMRHRQTKVAHAN